MENFPCTYSQTDIVLCCPSITSKEPSSRTARWGLGVFKIGWSLLFQVGRSVNRSGTIADNASEIKEGGIKCSTLPLTDAVN